MFAILRNWRFHYGGITEHHRPSRPGKEPPHATQGNERSPPVELRNLEEANARRRRPAPGRRAKVCTPGYALSMVCPWLLAGNQPLSPKRATQSLAWRHAERRNVAIRSTAPHDGRPPDRQQMARHGHGREVAALGRRAALGSAQCGGPRRNRAS